jgi:hypothetical protein
MKYKLIVPNGNYEANNLIKIAYEVIKHRLKHFLNGDGWID